jgi:hypothetical protein
MNQSILFAVGAGMGSGLLFILPMKGSMLGMWMSVLAPLPLLIVAMGFGARAGLVTAGVGAAIAALFQPGLALLYILSSALPSLILAAITRRVFTVADPLAPGTLLTAITALAIVAVWCMIGFAAFSYGGFDNATRDITRSVEGVMKDMKGMEQIPDFASVLVASVPAIMAFWSVLAMVLNLYLAMKVVRISGLFHGDLPDLPTTTVMPKVVLIAFALALLVCLPGGVPRLIGSVAAVALGTAFMLQGLAGLHRITRGNAFRSGLLSLLYGLIIILFPLPLFVVAGVGLADQLRLLRRPDPNQPTSNNT